MGGSQIHWDIKPLVGVGPLKLTWTRDELRLAMADLGLPVTPRKKGSKEIDTLANRSVHLHYSSEGRLQAIECWEDEATKITFKECDVLRAPPGEVLNLLSAEAPFDTQDPEIGYSYTFPELSIGLWREALPSPEQEAQFQSVLVGVAGYYSDG